MWVEIDMRMRLRSRLTLTMLSVLVLGMGLAAVLSWRAVEQLYLRTQGALLHKKSYFRKHHCVNKNVTLQRRKEATEGTYVTFPEVSVKLVTHLCLLVFSSS